MPSLYLAPTTHIPMVAVGNSTALHWLVAHGVIGRVSSFFPTASTCAIMVNKWRPPVNVGEIQINIGKGDDGSLALTNDMPSYNI